MKAIHRFTLPYPPSANDYWTVARNRIVLTAKARAYKKAVAAALAGHLPIAGPVVGEFRLYRPRRIGDLGNGLKVVEDSLNGIAYLDDSQVEEYRVFRRFDDPDNPRVELVYEGERFYSRPELEQVLQAKSATRQKRKRAAVAKKRTVKKWAW